MSRLGQVRPASRAQLRARVAFDGPAGSGKTWTALEWATVLAEGGRVLVIDTEHGSSALYSDRFVFEILEWAPPYDPSELAATIRDAGAGDWAVIVIDSLSHFWEGEGGTLDIVDSAAQRAKGNSFAGWKTGTPVLRHLVDTILAAPAHVIATMRSRTEWVIETDERGRSVPRRVGMAPVMRAGIEFEFQVVGDLDIEHRLTISKSRCAELADLVVQPGRAGETAERFRAWLTAGETAGPADPTAVDQLVAALNAITDPQMRAETKREFVSRFGRPQDLTADRVDAARDWVTQQVAPLDEGAGAPRSDAVEETEGTTESPPLVDPDGGCAVSSLSPDGESAAQSPEGARVTPEQRQQRRMHAIAARIWPVDEIRDRLIALASAVPGGRRIESRREIDLDLGQRMIAALEEIEQGNAELHLRATGTWTLRHRRRKEQ